jgi:nucleotide-binding universal stress UspA family protein
MTIEPIFAEGNNIAGTILYTAEQRGADLLVMNTRGRSPAAAILLGSVVTQGIVETKVAILVVKHFGAMMNLFQALQQSQFWARHNPKTN